MIPLISSKCQGLLGVSHLPRLWWKVICETSGALDPAYVSDSGGPDTWVLKVLDIDAHRAHAYLRSERPDYLTFEQWARENGTIDRHRIDRWNRGIKTRVFVDPAKLDARRRDIPLPDSDPFVSAVLLDCLRDWSLCHKHDLGVEGSDIPAQVSPLISSIDTGRLGVCQLPRTWLKVILDARGLLHPDYPACGGGLDQNVLDALGLDRQSTLDFLTKHLPPYHAFEDWVIEQIGTVDREAVDSFHSFMYNRRHPEPKRTGILKTIGRPDDGTLHNGVLMNHLEDWRYAYNALTQRES